MPYPLLAAGQVLTADMLRSMQIQSVEQGSQQDVTSSTTLVNSNLIIPTVAGAEYRYWLLISYVASTAGDLSCAWSVPANGAVERFGAGLGDIATVPTNINAMTHVQFRRPATGTVIIVGGGGAGQGVSYHESGKVEAGDGGNVIWQFAQGTSNATATSVTPTSRLEWVRIG